MTRAVGVTLFVSILAAFAPARAQRDGVAGQFGEQIEVRMVQVDAWASESGKPVYDLAQSELRLTEDGKPVEILYFAAPIAEIEAEGSPGSPAGEGSPVAGEPRVEPATVAIFLDSSHLGVGSRSRAIDALQEWLRSSIPARAGAMLVQYRNGLEVLVPRTRDHAKIVEKLEELRVATTEAAQARSDEVQTLQRIRERQRAGIERERDLGSGLAGRQEAGRAPGGADESGISGSLPLNPDAPCRSDLLQMAEELADRVTTTAKGSLGALGAFADALSLLQGRKILLFASDGIPSRPGGVAFDYVRTLCDGSGMREGIQYAIDLTAVGNRALPGQLNASTLALAGENRSLAGLVDQVVARANTSGVSVWSLDARGLATGEVDASTEIRISTTAAAARRTGEAQDVMQALASDTGGRAILNTNDFGGELIALADDMLRAYSIAYASSRTGDGRLHKIRLETTRKGVTLRYRRSWRDSSTEEELSELVGGALELGFERPGLGATAVLGRQKAPDGAERLVLRLTLRRESLTATPTGDGGTRAMLRVAIAFRPEGGESTPVRSKVIQVDLAGESNEPIVQDIGLPNVGEGTLVAVGLRDERSGDVGVFRLVAGRS